MFSPCAEACSITLKAQSRRAESTEFALGPDPALIFFTFFCLFLRPLVTVNKANQDQNTTDALSNYRYAHENPGYLT